jgi:hypothetical protein
MHHHTCTGTVWTIDQPSGEPLRYPAHNYSAWTYRILYEFRTNWFHFPVTLMCHPSSKNVLRTHSLPERWPHIFNAVHSIWLPHAQFDWRDKIGWWHPNELLVHPAAKFANCLPKPCSPVCRCLAFKPSLPLWPCNFRTISLTAQLCGNTTCRQEKMPRIDMQHLWSAV